MQPAERLLAQGQAAMASSNAKAADSALWPVLALLAWSVASSLMILGHKIAMVDKGFHFPLTLTAGEQIASALAGVLLSKAGVLPLGRAPSAGVFLLRVLPSVVSFAGTLYLGNLAYLSLSMAFIQMLKAMVPAITLVLCLVGGLQRFSFPVLTSIMAITVGTSLLAFLEMGTASFNMGGFIAFTASAVLESLRVVLVDVLMGQLKYNAAEVLLYVGLPTGVILSVAAWLVEGQRLAAYGLSIAASNPGIFGALAVASASVNLFSFLAIRLTSSLTFKTVGCMKNVVVVYLGVLMGDQVTTMQLVGYLIAIGGFVKYTVEQQRTRQMREQEQLTAVKKTH